MSTPVWHYSANAWDTACGRRVAYVAVSTTDTAEVTCKACIRALDALGAR
jgi:hypothetical protein